jgi:hypothetical protein
MTRPERLDRPGYGHPSVWPVRRTLVGQNKGRVCGWRPAHLDEPGTAAGETPHGCRPSSVHGFAPFAGRRRKGCTQAAQLVKFSDEVRVRSASRQHLPAICHPSAIVLPLADAHSQLPLLPHPFRGGRWQGGWHQRPVQHSDRAVLRLLGYISATCWPASGLVVLERPQAWERFPARSSTSARRRT